MVKNRKFFKIVFSVLIVVFVLSTFIVSSFASQYDSAALNVDNVYSGDFYSIDLSAVDGLGTSFEIDGVSFIVFDLANNMLFNNIYTAIVYDGNNDAFFYSPDGNLIINNDMVFTFVGFESDISNYQVLVDIVDPYYFNLGDDNRLIDITLNEFSDSIVFLKNGFVQTDYMPSFTIIIDDFQRDNLGVTYPTTIRSVGNTVVMSFVDDMGDYISRTIYTPTDGWEYFNYFSSHDFNIHIYTDELTFINFISVLDEGVLTDYLGPVKNSSFNSGYTAGKSDGLRDGYRSGYDAATSGNFSIQWRTVGNFLLTSIGAFFNNPIMPGIAIGGVLSLVVGIGLFMFVLKLLR